MKNYSLLFAFVSLLFSNAVFATDNFLNSSGDCPNEIITLQIGDCVSYTFQLSEPAFGNVIWDFSDAGAEASGVIIDHTFPGPGTYTVCANPVSMECQGLCIEVVVEECVQGCGLEVEILEQGECGYYVMEAYDFPDGAQLQWFLNGNLYNVGHITTFDLDEGQNFICVMYETPECPSGVEWCEEFLVNCGNECQQNDVTFSIDSWTNQEGPSALTWTISPVWDEVLASGFVEYNSENPYFDGSICLADGCYELIVQSAAPFNPNGIDISVSNNGEPTLPLDEFNIISNSSIHYFFGINNDCFELYPPCDASFTLQDTPNGTIGTPLVYSDYLYYAWMVDGQFYSDNPFETFTLAPGEHEICLYIESGFCLEESCQTINVTNGDCPAEINVYPSENCNSFAFQLPEPAFGNVIWDFSDAGAENSGTSIDHTFPGPGTYTVCANPVSMVCQGFCIEVVVEECAQDCGLEVEILEQGECGYYVMEAYDFPDGAQLQWFLNGNLYNVGHITTFDLEDGSNFICVMYETPECPSGVEWCEEFLVNCGNECEQNEVSFGIDSWTNQGGPAVVYWSIAHAISGISIESGTAEYNSENPFFDGSVCLEDGCYQLLIQSPQPFNPQGLDLSVVFNGETIEPVGGLNYFENVSIQYYFGVNSDCSELNPPCNAEFSLQNTPSGVLAAALEFSEDLYYTWSVNGQYYSDGPQTIFTLGPGEYEICMSIESGFCLETLCQMITVPEIECSAVFLTVNTIGPDMTDLEGQTFTVYNSDEEVVNVFTANYNEAEAWTWNTCLLPGCYSVEVQGDCCMNYGPNLDTYYIIEMAGNNVQMSPFYQFNEELGYFNFSVNSDCLEPWNCDMELWTANPSCEMGQFEIGSFVEGGEYVWNFGDGTTVEGGHFIEHEYDETGYYEVCVTYTTPNCNYYITQCATVEIECVTDCPTELYVGDGGNCGYYVFETSNFAEGESVNWTFGDGSFQTGGHFTQHHYEEPGIYTVMVEYSSNACPDGVTLFAVVNVEPCEGDCPTQLYASATGDCGNWIFETSNFAEGEQVVWSFGDGTTEEGGHFADHHYDTPGVYTVYAQYTSNACPNVTTLTAVVHVEACETECTEVTFAFDSFVESFGPSFIEYSVVNAFGEVFLSGSTSYSEEDPYHDDLACLPDGCYEVMIWAPNSLENVEFYSAPFIDGTTLSVFDVYYGDNTLSYEFSVNSDCNPACTEFNINVFSNPFVNGPTSGVISIFDQDENMLAFEEYWTDGITTQTFSFCLPDGCYTIITDGGCCIVYGQNFEFSGSDNVSFGDYTPLDAVSGTMPFSLNGACEWDSSCEPVQLTVSGTFVGEAVVEWILESDEYELSGLLPLDALLNGDFVIDWCLPQECFSITFQSDGPLPMEALLLQLYAEQLQEELGAFEMSFGADFIQFDFGYNEACVVGLDEPSAETIKIYPNPSQGIFTIELPSTPSNQNVQVFDMSGRVVYTATVSQSVSRIDLSALSIGLYQLNVTSEREILSTKIQILR